MEPDFSGWATKAGLKCSDGRTILPGAFAHQDKTQLPLVWQHGHKDPENVLGHVLLEDREGSVWVEGFFNDTPKGKHMKEAVQHGDVNQMSIWANQLSERMKQVVHGTIREVSLVLSGANPGAFIENVSIKHSDGEVEELPEEAIIYTGIPIEHSTPEPEGERQFGHAAGDGGDGPTIQDVYDSMTEEQRTVTDYLVGEALASAGDNAPVQHDDINLFAEGFQKGLETNMKHNVFDGDDEGSQGPVLTHDDMKSIIADATKIGSLKAAVTDYAIAHSITDIDVMFPDAKPVDGGVPEWI